MAKFVRHFRIYLKNNHPAYIVDEEGDDYFYHRTSHNKKISGKNAFCIKNNPLVNSNEAMYIEKKRQKDKKKRFSLFKLKTKKGRDISYKFIDSDFK